MEYRYNSSKLFSEDRCQQQASEQARGRVKRRNDAPQKVSFPDLFIRMQPPSHGDGILTVMILQNYWVDIRY